MQCLTSLLMFLHTVCSVRYDAVKQRIGYFWQLDNANLNLNYSVEGNRANNCAYSPNTPTYQRPSGPFGDYSCDPPQELIRSAAGFMKTVRGEEVDFILWTGDSGPSSEESNPQQLRDNLAKMTSILREEFPYSSIYPVLGHADVQAAGVTSEMYRYVSQLWDTWLPPSAVRTLREGGYYKVELAGRRLQLVGLNTPLWTSKNKMSRLDFTGDPGYQFDWLEKVLDKARTKQQTVIIFGHSPPGVFEIGEMKKHWYHPVFNSRYNRLVIQYSDVIVGQLFGHQNTDSFRIFRDVKNRPVSWALISPGLSPRTVWSGSSDPITSNPSTRLYKYSTYDGQLLDFSQFTLSLDHSNSVLQSQWKLQYNFSTQYSVGGITSSSLDQVHSHLRSNPRGPMFESYLLSNSQLAPITCTDTCRHLHLCAIDNIDYGQYKQCVITSGSRRTSPSSAILIVALVICLLSGTSQN